MPQYRRHRIQGGTYFFTVVLANRRTALLTEHIDKLRGAFADVKAKHPFHIDAIVVLPDHLHCIMTLPKNDDDFSLRWRQIKSAFSRRIPHGEYRSRSRQRKGERGIWQRRFWEHAIRDDIDWQRHVDYVHYNPVKHGWVDIMRHWPYSSFHRFVARGMYSEDWGGMGDDEIDAGE